MNNKITKSVFSLGLMLTSILVQTSTVAGPLTDPYLSHTYTAGNQVRPKVGVGASGDHVVMFGDSARGGAFSRLYNANGSPLYTSELFMNVPAAVDVAMDGNGNYVVIRMVDDGSGNDVYATVYNKQGSIIVNPFRVNSMVTGNQDAADVAMNRNGDFVVIWTDTYAAGAPGAYAKRFNLNGTPLTSDLRVSNVMPSTSFQAAMSVAMDETGGFAVTYLISYQSTTNSSDVWARQYNAMGLAVTNPFRVNTTINGPQDGSDIVIDAYGNYMVTWESFSDGDGTGVYAQRYNNSSVKIGGEFLVNSSVIDMQRYSSSAMAADGSFVVTWMQWNSITNTPAEVYAREFGANGIARGDQFKVSGSNSNKNELPNVGMDACGNYVITWESRDASNNKDVYVRRYAAASAASAICLANGKTVSRLTGVAGSWKYFKITVAPGQSTLDIQQTGFYGDADLYVRYGALPTTSLWHARPWLNGSDERVIFSNPPAGDWYIGVNGYSNYVDVNLNAQSY